MAHGRVPLGPEREAKGLFPKQKRPPRRAFGEVI